MLPGSAVLGPRNGLTGAAVLFVGEAPGRLGAGRTGIPFSGDTAGARFERLLAEAGLTREGVFVTNAALCVPLDTRGRNRRPAAGEIAACSRWLGETIALVKPPLVVALGATALAALARIEPHGLTLREHVAKVVPWHGAGLTALYHPGARSQVHRPWPLQVEDWQELGTFTRTCKDNSRDLKRNLPAEGLTPGQSHFYDDIVIFR
jgi:uracil-DNA glycosylase family 4